VLWLFRAAVPTVDWCRHHGAMTDATTRSLTATPTHWGAGQRQIAVAHRLSCR